MMRKLSIVPCDVGRRSDRAYREPPRQALRDDIAHQRSGKERVLAQSIAYGGHTISGWDKDGELLFEGGRKIKANVLETGFEKTNNTDILIPISELPSFPDISYPQAPLGGYMQLLRYLNPRVRTLMISSFLCLVSSLPFVGCSDEAVAPPEDPASLSMVWFPSIRSNAFDYYAEGDTILFMLTNNNHRLEVVGGKVCVDGLPVLEFDRIDSTVYEPSVGNYVSYKTPLEQVSTLSGDGRIIRCVLPNIPAESLNPVNYHEWYLHLSRATSSEYGDRRGSFMMEK